MIFLYRLIYQILKALALVLRPLLSNKTQRWIQLRMALQSAAFRNLEIRKSLWIHTSSGEIEYAKSLIKKIRESRPQQKIVVTYSSESAEKLFKNIQSEVEAFIPLPWDDVYSIRLMIKKLDPQLLIFSRTDLWPEMIHQCVLQKIPIGLISYFPKINFLSSIYLKSALQKFSFVSCVDENTKVKVENLVSKPNPVIVRADGDTRFDQVFSRLEQASLIPPPTGLHPIITLGSTWPEDENQLEALMAELLSQYWRVIISPHDVSENNLIRIETQFAQKKYQHQRLSQISMTRPWTSSILLIDRIGFLADAYRFSEIAFVGGSFKSRVHSVMEPLCCGLPVLVGPSYQNSPEATRYSKTNPAYVLVASNSTELVAHFTKIRTQNLVGLKNQIKTEMLKNRGSSERLTHFILDNFLKSSNS